MFTKNKTKILLGLFVFLALIVAYLMLFNNGEERSFRKELVNVDTSKVNEIFIYPNKKNEVIHLIKESGNWKVKLAGNKTASVQKNKIINLLNELVKIKPEVLAAREKNKWHEFQVDSSGIQIKILEKGNLTLDIIVGRISFQQPRSVSTYVRLANDVDVYKTEGYLGIMLNKTASDFRNTTIISGDKTNWTKLSFQYPSDSSFILAREGNRWKIGNTITDSVKTEQMLSGLTHISATDFNDNFTPGKFQKPVYKLVIEMSDTTAIQVDAYLDSSKVIVHSSQNPESYFNLNKDLYGRIFPGLNRFLRKK